jgi:hypothetical protein
LSETAHIEPELVHVRDQGEKGFGERITVARLPGGVKVIETLLHG